MTARPTKLFMGQRAWIANMKDTDVTLSRGSLHRLVKWRAHYVTNGKVTAPAGMQMRFWLRF